MYYGEYLHKSVCTCVCLCMGFVQAQRVLISTCVGVFLLKLMQSGEVSASTVAGYH